MRKDLVADFTEFIRYRRKLVRPPLSQRAAAIKAGISSVYYERLEQGRATNPSEAILLSLSRAFGLHTAEEVEFLEQFGPGRNVKRITLTLPSEITTQLATLAQEQKTYTTTLIRKFIVEGIRREGPNQT